MNKILSVLLLAITVAAKPLTLDQAIEQYRLSPSLSFWGRFAAKYKIGVPYKYPRKRITTKTKTEYYNLELGRYQRPVQTSKVEETFRESEIPLHPLIGRLPPIDPAVIIANMQQVIDDNWDGLETADPNDYALWRWDTLKLEQELRAQKMKYGIPLTREEDIARIKDMIRSDPDNPNNVLLYKMIEVLE